MKWLTDHLWASLPAFGSFVLYMILASAALTFVTALAAGTARPRLLRSARFGAYATVALVGLAVLTLSFAFVSHDFRLSYVSRYSDRSMTIPYQFVALWGGQDGSWLWWLFLTAVFSGGCVFWLGRRYLELQPYVIATLAAVIGFDALLMIFAVSPFATNIGGAPVDGAGLNYQLRNFYMIIHPPALYAGFTSATIPFAFCVAALVTGRLDNEWINATRKWMVFSWLFLTIGNILGMLWAYDELGWGGDWAWDPVENAACLPWWTASAYVHSTMIQERRGMLKIWNVVLIALTFLATIYGTFLTRSGLIASVHSFAQSGIGAYFIYYMAFLVAVTVGLIVWRLPLLRSEGQLESVMSRETAFLANNWALLGCGAFIFTATSWPLFSEYFLKYQSSVGPTFYNFWLPIPFITLFLLMSVAPLLGWRKTSPELFRKSFYWPTVALFVGVAIHIGIGGLGTVLRGTRLEMSYIGPLRMPIFFDSPNLYPLPEGPADWVAHLTHQVGKAVAKINGAMPLFVTAIASFKLAVVVQEFARGIRARQNAAEQKKTHESTWVSLFQLVSKSRRRYGGYIVHLGIVLLYIHFTGRAWSTDIETVVAKGDTLQIDEVYSVVYRDSKRISDPEKMVILSEIDVYERGKLAGHVTPAKYIYKSMGGQMSTEVALHITLRDDLYVTLANVDPQTETATFQFHVNPLAIGWILVAALLMCIGAIISLFPDIQDQERPILGYGRAAFGVAMSLMLVLALFAWPTSSRPAGGKVVGSSALAATELLR